MRIRCPSLSTRNKHSASREVVLKEIGVDTFALEDQKGRYSAFISAYALLVETHS